MRDLERHAPTSIQLVLLELLFLQVLDSQSELQLLCLISTKLQTGQQELLLPQQHLAQLMYSIQVLQVDHGQPFKQSIVPTISLRQVVSLRRLPLHLLRLQRSMFVSIVLMVQETIGCTLMM